MRILRATEQCSKCPPDATFKDCYRQQFQQNSFTRIESAREEVNFMLELIESLERFDRDGEYRAMTGHFGFSLYKNEQYLFSVDPIRSNGSLQYRLSQHSSLKTEGTLSEIMTNIGALL